MSNNSRRPLISGNWKMNQNHYEAIQCLQKLAYLVGKDDFATVDVSIHAPFTDIRSVQTLIDADDLKFLLGAQHCYFEDKGAFTGEVSAAMLAGTVDFAIIGHSERRHVFGETDEQTQRKLRAVLDLGMQPMLAVGELRAQREDGSTNDVLRRQLLAAFQDVDRLPEGFIVAYEPVWAIGTGLTATPEIAQATCADVRAILADRFDAATAEACRIQYGGSVNAENAAMS